MVFMQQIEKTIENVDVALMRRGFAYCEFLASEIKVERSFSDSFGRANRMRLDALNPKDDFVDVNDFEEHYSPPQRSVVNVKL